MDKISTIKYCIQNPQILDAFDIEAVNLNRLVNGSKTRDANFFTRAEFAKLLRAQKKELLEHSQFGVIGKVGQQNGGSQCLLNKEQVFVSFIYTK